MLRMEHCCNLGSLWASRDRTHQIKKQTVNSPRKLTLWGKGGILKPYYLLFTLNLQRNKSHHKEIRPHKQMFMWIGFLLLQINRIWPLPKDIINSSSSSRNQTEKKPFEYHIHCHPAVLLFSVLTNLFLIDSSNWVSNTSLSSPPLRNTSNFRSTVSAP